MDLIEQIYKTKTVYNIDNKPIKLKANVGISEGKTLYDLVMSLKCKNALEIGMAFGLSALFMCIGLKKTNGKLTSIDPNQDTKWENIGTLNIKRAKLQKHHNVIIGKSYNELPKLLNKKKKYELIFIDGWHTFDYCLIDFFYSDLMLKIGGVIVIDDVLHSGVKKVVAYIITNYKHYELIPTDVKTICIFKKKKEDDRDWFFHENF